MAIARLLADRLGCPVASVEVGRFAGELDRLVPADLAGLEFLDAIADYAATHAPSSVRHLLSTWRPFALHLVAREQLEDNPVDELEGPKRPEWLSQALAVEIVPTPTGREESERSLDEGAGALGDLGTPRLTRAAEEWLALGRTRKLSPATEAARRHDLMNIAFRLAHTLTWREQLTTRPAVSFTIVASPPDQPAT